MTRWRGVYSIFDKHVATSERLRNKGRNHDLFIFGAVQTWLLQRPASWLIRQEPEDSSAVSAGHPEFTVDFQHALNEYRVANGSMTVEEKSLAEQSMLEYPVSKENANELATALQAFLKMSSQRSVWEQVGGHPVHFATRTACRLNILSMGLRFS